MSVAMTVAMTVANDRCHVLPAQVMKMLAHIRCIEFFQCSELVRDTVPQARDTGNLLQLSGMQYVSLRLGLGS